MLRSCVDIYSVRVCISDCRRHHERSHVSTALRNVETYLKTCFTFFDNTPVWMHAHVRLHKVRMHERVLSK